MSWLTMTWWRLEFFLIMFLVRCQLCATVERGRVEGMLFSTVARLPEGSRWLKVLKKLLYSSVMSCCCAPVVLAACLSLGQEQVCCFSVPCGLYFCGWTNERLAWCDFLWLSTFKSLHLGVPHLMTLRFPYANQSCRTLYTLLHLHPLRNPHPRNVRI